MKTRVKMLSCWALVGAGALFLAGCSSVGVGITSPTADPQQIVSERAQARWQALVDGNIKTAYEFISPAGRKVLSQDLYRAKIKPGLWRGAKTQSVTCIEELCEASVLVKYDIRDIKGLEIEMKESWVKEEGNWWYVQKK